MHNQNLTATVFVGAKKDIPIHPKCISGLLCVNILVLVWC